MRPTHKTPNGALLIPLTACAERIIRQDGNKTLVLYAPCLINGHVQYVRRNNIKEIKRGQD